MMDETSLDNPDPAPKPWIGLFVVKFSQLTRWFQAKTTKTLFFDTFQGHSSPDGCPAGIFGVSNAANETPIVLIGVTKETNKTPIVLIGVTKETNKTPIVLIGVTKEANKTPIVLIGVTKEANGTPIALNGVTKETNETPFVFNGARKMANKPPKRGSSPESLRHYNRGCVRPIPGNPDMASAFICPAPPADGGRLFAR